MVEECKIWAKWWWIWEQWDKWEEWGEEIWVCQAWIWAEEITKTKEKECQCHNKWVKWVKNKCLWWVKNKCLWEWIKNKCQCKWIKNKCQCRWIKIKCLCKCLNNNHFNKTKCFRIKYNKDYKDLINFNNKVDINRIMSYKINKDNNSLWKKVIDYWIARDQDDYIVIRNFPRMM